MEYSITRMIMLLSRKGQSCIASVVDSYDLTVAEGPFFMALHKHEGVTQEALTAIVSVDKAATARAVKSLEEKGFLIRKQDEKDKRRNRLYATEKANKLYPLVKADLLAMDARITEGIGEDDQEKIYSTLQIIEQNFISMCEEKNEKKVKKNVKERGGN